MSVSIKQIIQAIEQAAPLSLQEEWDNCGLLVGSSARPCTGVMLALDVTPSVVSQAIETGCNLIVSHHPLIFKGVKVINDLTPQGAAIIEAIEGGVSVYCAHTSLDNAPAPFGVSCMMAEILGADIISPLSASGTGVLARLRQPLSPSEFAAKVREAFTSRGARISSGADVGMIELVALGSGACGFLIPQAIDAGAQAMVTSDVRYHDFLDYGKSIFIVDLTHFDTEKCTKEIFKRIISQKIPNFADVFCASENNPIDYL